MTPKYCAEVEEMRPVRATSAKVAFIVMFGDCFVLELGN